MAGHIFISYRRSENTRDARALYERLRREFGEERVFIDLEGVEPGEDFVESLEHQLEACAALVVLIGPDWSNGRDEAGMRRLDDEDDFVRIELEAALRRKIKIFPVLLDGAALPIASNLPESLRSLVRRQAVSLDYMKFDADAARLAHAIRKAIDVVGRVSLPTDPKVVPHQSVEPDHNLHRPSPPFSFTRSKQAAFAKLGAVAPLVTCLVLGAILLFLIVRKVEAIHAGAAESNSALIKQALQTFKGRYEQDFFSSLAGIDTSTEKVNSVGARTLNQTGLAEVANQSYDAAEAAFREASRADPTSAEIANNLGFVLTRTGKKEEAEQYLATSVRLNPRRADAWYSLANLYADDRQRELSSNCLLAGYAAASDKAAYLTRLGGLVDSDPSATIANAARDAMARLPKPQNSP